MSGKPPVPISESLAAVTRDLRSATPDALAMLTERFAAVVGNDVATHAQVGSLIDGVLTITVDEPAAATVLRDVAPQLAQAFREALGQSVVQQIRVVVKGANRRRREASE